MFRSKGFTIAFSILALLIVFLTFVFCYLVFSGKGSRFVESRLIERTSTDEANATSETTTETTTTTEAETTTEPTTTQKPADHTLRILTEEDEHEYPVIGEEIPEKGVLTVIRAGDEGEGLTFHKLPRFDSMTAPGNVINYSGSFDIVSKVYIMENGRPFLMYKTEDGYYVTSSDYYVTYEKESAPSTPMDVTKIVSYGYDDPAGVVVTVHQDDGNTMALSIYDYDAANSSTAPLLANLIAEYDSEGIAHFEYHNTDDRIYEGTVSFLEPEENSFAMKRIKLTFSSAVKFAVGDVTEVVLHN